MSNDNMDPLSSADMPDDALLARYFSGTATEEDNARVYAWLGNDPGRREELDFRSDVWRESPEAVVRGDADAVWRGIQRRTGVTDGTTADGKVVALPLGRPRAVIWAGLAAAALLMGVFGVRNAQRLFPQKAVVPVVYSTTTGQRANVTLSDGSRVILAPATVLRVLDKEGRSIELNGEAVFSVSSSSKEPFTVKSGNIVTRVLGTTFGVRYYNGDVRVAVRDGRVSIGSAVLSSNDVALIQRDKTTILHNANFGDLTAWTSGRIVFDDTPTAEVLAELRRWYDVEFKVDSRIVERHITASIEAGQLSEVLDVLALTLGARYSQAGRVVTLFP